MDEHQLTAGKKLAQFVGKLGAFLFIEVKIPCQLGVFGRTIIGLTDPSEDPVAKFHKGLVER